MNLRRRGRWLFSAVLLAALVVSMLPPVSSARAQGPDPAMPEPVRAPAAVNAVTCPENQFLAQYYNNTTFSGTPVLEQCETPPLAYDGKAAVAAGVNTTNFSARYTGRFHFNAATYRFLLRHDDTLKLLVDDGALVYQGTSYALDPQLRTRPMTAGAHNVQIDFTQGTGPWQLYAGWMPEFTDTCTNNYLKADYYVGTTASGTPLFSRCEEPPIHYEWGTVGGPYGLRVGNFSVHWNGTVDGSATSTIFPPGASRFSCTVIGEMEGKLDGLSQCSLTNTTNTAPDPLYYDKVVSAMTTHTIDATYKSTTASAAAVNFSWGQQPQSCGAPRNSLVARDEEVFVTSASNADAAPYVVTPNNGWEATKCCYSYKSADVVKVTNDYQVLAGIDNENQLGYKVLDSYSNGLVEQRDWVYAKTSAIISRYPGSFTIFIRPYDDPNTPEVNEEYTIKYIEATVRVTGTVQLGTWLTVDGVGTDPPIDDVPDPDRAYSNLAVVARDANHMQVFYKDSGNHVWFNEWEGGAWQAEPTSLGGTINSDLTAVAPSSEMVAVFGLGSTLLPYVKAWTATNKADWSDVGWYKLATFACQNERMAVVAPDVNNIFAACRTGAAAPPGANALWSWQWARTATSAGWTAGSQVTTLPAVNGPLTLVAPDVGKLWLEWADPANIWRVVWDQATGWGQTPPLLLPHGSSVPPGKVIATVMRPNWVNHFARISNGDFKDFTWKWQDAGGMTHAGMSYTKAGVPDGQALVRVDGKTVWASVYQNANKGWELLLVNPVTGVTLASQQLVASGVSLWTDGVIDLTYGDYDADGDDELVILRRDTATATTVTLYKVDMDWSVTPFTKTVTAQTVSSRDANTSFTGPVSAAIGDLNGDGKAGELILATYMSTNTGWLTLLEYNSATQIFDLKRRDEHAFTSYVNEVDLNVAIGRVRDLRGEQVVVSISECKNPDECNRRHSYVSAYQYAKSGTTWTPTFLTGIYESDRTRGIADYYYPTIGNGSGGPLGTSLVLADADGDGLEEVVWSIAKWFYTYGFDTNNPADDRVVYTQSYEMAGNGLRSIAAGDSDGDGRDEVIETMVMGSSGYRELVWDWYQRTTEPDGKGWMLYVDSYSVAGARAVLIGDVDGDSLVAQLASCQIVTNAQVVAVVYSPPSYYDSTGQPEQEGETSYGVTSGGEFTEGSTLKISAGLEVELEIEYGLDIGIFKSTCTDTWGAEIEYEWNKTTEHSTGSEVGSGWSTSHGPGQVIYSSVSQKCYTYDLYTFDTGERRGQSVACIPTSSTANELKSSSIVDWNMEYMRKELGATWAPVARESTDVYDYPPVIPSSYNVIWEGVEKTVGRDSTGSLSSDWDRSQTTGTTKSTSNGIMGKLSYGFGTEVKGIGNGAKFQIKASFGMGGEWSNSTSWTTGLEIGSSIQFNPNVNTRSDYKVTPYWAFAETKNLAGNQYQYLVADFAVSTPPSAQSEPEDASSPAAAGPGRPLLAQPTAPLPQQALPAAPIITSPTHPDENAWYTGRDVTFTWQQPAGDPATVIGYRWQLTPEPDLLPLTRIQPGNTFTYQNLKDGVYHMNVLAASQRYNGDGPVAHRTVRIDGDKPAAKIALDPPSPNGAGWYNTPVTAEITADDGLGSGVASIEYSTDGSAWQPYGGPVTFDADTAGLTLYARATDGVGHVSDVVQAGMKIDRTPPSTVDADGYGLSYARIDQDESGNNVQLVLGGALNDSLSGRAQVEISTGDAAATDAGWQAVNAVGDFPMPPGNLFPPGQAVGLNWIYTPTFEIRGVYNIYGHGIDQAGNRETGWGAYPIGTLFWPPDGNPNLSESRLTASPSIAKPGETVRFTLGLRNSGVQEAAVKIVDAVPAGLTVAPESISHGGIYDPATRQVQWQVHASWPNRVQYLTFEAVVDAGARGQLPSQANLTAYWPGYENDPSKVFSFVLANVVTVAPATAAAAELLPPQILDVVVAEGPAVGNRQITLNVLAATGARYLYVKEWTLDPLTGAWLQAAASDWLPIGPGMTVNDDIQGRHLTIPWTLTAGEGVHYLGVWAGDGNQLPSNLNESGLTFTNLIGTPFTVAAGGRIQYRLPLAQLQQAILALVTTGGDADLFVWSPRSGFKPFLWSNAEGEPPVMDSVNFYAPETGDYLVEVHGVTDASFVLALAGALQPAGPVQENLGEPVLPASVHNADKQRPDHPETLSTPFSLPGAEVPGAVVPPTPLKLYLPVVSGGAGTSGPAAPAVPEFYPARERKP